MELKTIGKRLATEPIKASLVQGENGVNRMEIHTPRYLDDMELTDFVFKIRGNDSKGALVEQVLEKTVTDGEIILIWEVSARFTAVAGPLALELDAISPDGGGLVKFSAADITIRETLGMPPVPAEDIFEKALNDISVLQETKLSAENLIAGENISISAEGKNVTISAEGGSAIDDENASAETVYSSAKLERDFAGRNAIGEAVQEAVNELEFPVASESSLGCIKVGRNLVIDSSGTLSAVSSGSGGGTSIDDGEASLVTVYSSAKVEADFARKSEVSEAVSEKADKAHSHAEYLTSASISDMGDMKKSVYDTNDNGIVDNAEKVNGLTVATAVPANAKFTDTTYEVVSTTANGLCPKRSGTTTKFLRDDGTWNTPPNTTYSAATTSANGLMTSEMVTKLNGIAAGANKYTLPTATASALGGVKVGSGLAISGGVLSATGKETKELIFKGIFRNDETLTLTKAVTGYSKLLIVADDRRSYTVVYTDPTPVGRNVMIVYYPSSYQFQVTFTTATEIKISVNTTEIFASEIYGIK